MGALAGHLAHLQENLDFTFGELKSILGDVVSGEMPVVEKVDGQNIFFAISVDPETGNVRTARNKGDLLKGGMTPEEFTAKWKGHPAESAFMKGFDAIKKGLDQVGKAELAEIFSPGVENGRRFVNAEIVYTGNPNVINYGGDYIVMHNLQEFGPDGKLIDVMLRDGDFGRLVQAVDTSQSELDEASWKVIGPQVTQLRDLSGTDALDKVVDDINALGVSDDTTLENAFVIFEPSSSDTILYYYCLFHGGMANDAKIPIDGFVEQVPEVVATTITVQNSGASDYIFTAEGLQGNDPTLTLVRGKTYEFDVSAGGHPFWIKTIQGSGSFNQYNEGITNNGASIGKLTFTVPNDAPSTLYYNCQYHGSMTGKINIVDNNDNGNIIQSSGSSSNNTGSTPSYGGYILDLDLPYSFDQEIIPPSGYDI